MQRLRVEGEGRGRYEDPLQQKQRFAIRHHSSHRLSIVTPLTVSPSSLLSLSLHRHSSHRLSIVTPLTVSPSSLLSPSLHRHSSHRLSIVTPLTISPSSLLSPSLHCHHNFNTSHNSLKLFTIFLLYFCLHLLPHHHTGTVRLLMRRFQVHKVACNHALVRNMAFGTMQSNEKAWCWVANDFSEEVLSVLKLAVRFKVRVWV